MKKFAFLVHPRILAREDMGKVFYPFYFFPEIILKRIIPYLPPIIGGKVKFLKEKEIIGWIIWIPLLGEQIFSLPKEFVLKKIIKAIEKAKKLGAEIIGLGELISPITHGGEDLIGKTEKVVITTGNSLTAGVILKAVEKISIIKKIDLSKEKVAIVGAGGSVGQGTSILLAEKGIPLILIETHQERLENLKRKISQFNNLIFGRDIFLIKDAKIVVVVTSSLKTIIRASYLKKGAVIYDITQPKNTSADLLKERKDLTIIDGGVIDTPRIDYGVDIGLKKYQAYACLVETIILALKGIQENYIGYTEPRRIKEMLRFMEEYSEDFKINIFQSFGKPLNENLEFNG